MIRSPLVLPPDVTYIGVFLTFSCTLRCSYCLNHHGGDLVKARRMSRETWIEALNRIQTRPDLPLTLQGGEPTVHKHFYDIVEGIRPETPVDLITNLELDVDRFMARVPSTRMRREASYASIRVSYHHRQSDFLELMRRALTLSHAGYSIGVWEVLHPGYASDVRERQLRAIAMGIDYRTKEFLGPWKGVTHGTMRYADAVNAPMLRYCECRTSELLIAPDGSIFRCHSDLYADRDAIGHILDETPPTPGGWRPCSVYGKCNSCDIRAHTTNAFTASGHSGVTIRNVGEPHSKNLQLQNVINTYGASVLRDKP